MTDQIPRLMRKAEVCNKTGLSERAISDRLAAGSFPKPVFIDARNPAWIESEVLAWIQQRIADRDRRYDVIDCATLDEMRLCDSDTRRAYFADLWEWFNTGGASHIAALLHERDISRFNARLRKIIKTRGHFPSDDAATKLIWLALRNITADWGRAAKDWKEAMNQFAILYAERFETARA